MQHKTECMCICGKQNQQKIASESSENVSKFKHLEQHQHTEFHACRISGQNKSVECVMPFAID